MFRPGRNWLQKNQIKKKTKRKRRFIQLKIYFPHLFIGKIDERFCGLVQFCLITCMLWIQHAEYRSQNRITNWINVMCAEHGVH